MKDKNTIKVEILILAAGQSKRMKGQNKLLKNLNGKPLIEYVVSESVKSRASVVSIIIQENNINLQNFLDSFPIKILKAQTDHIGIGHSISKGIELIEKNKPEGILILLGDMPDIKSKHLDLMINQFRKNPSNYILRASSENLKPGNPVLFPKIYYNLLKELKGDQGAKIMLNNYVKETKHIKLPKMAALTDLDTQEEFDEWKAKNL